MFSWRVFLCLQLFYFFCLVGTVQCGCLFTLQIVLWSCLSWIPVSDQLWWWLAFCIQFLYNTRNITRCIIIRACSIQLNLQGHSRNEMKEWICTADMLKLLHEGSNSNPYISPYSSIMHYLSHTPGLSKVHQGVGRLIKVYVAYLKAHPRCVIMLSAEVSKGKAGVGGGEWRKHCEEKKQQGGRIHVKCQVPAADKLDPSLTSLVLTLHFTSNRETTEWSGSKDQSGNVYWWTNMSEYSLSLYPLFITFTRFFSLILV